ncbi:ornithine cyclodeaminase family protein [Isoptericola sp. NPDC057559]|uniref:ornithine cyclodeaminase family protein n=1 Tax=Isoptericola sp. NPDC057559 TaxID=3346168 RepID=UPI0036CA0C89
MSTGAPDAGPRYLDAATVAAALAPDGAVDAITAALAGGFDPADDIPRVGPATSHGQLLLMPSEVGAHAGVKVATVAPANPERGLPRIQAAYLLFDAATLSLRAILDGTALTSLRTPAVSVAAVRHALVRVEAPLEVVVFGAGPQALGHVDTLAAVAARPLGSVTYVVRHPDRVPASVHESGTVLAADSGRLAAALAAAHVVVCATSARSPLFAADAVGPEAIVIAVGSHEPDARELDPDLLADATVIVEDVATALREAGDVILAIADGALSADDLVPMRDAVRAPDDLPARRRTVFKSVGMSWEDLAVAQAVVDRAP